MSALSWLEPLRSLLTELKRQDWAALGQLDDRLGQLTVSRPAAGPPGRAAFFLNVRRQLAAAGYATLTLPAQHGGTGRSAVLQALAQFACGWHDLDLRDATGLGHGALVLGAAGSAVRDRWVSRLAGGALVGIAATERHGGSRIQEITTRAVPAAGGRWLISGEKVWVSRLAEASGMVVFFRDPDGRISAAILDADTPGLTREAATPAGLTGWSWGTLGLHQVPVDPSSELIGAPGAGLQVFRDHFTRFRPLVTATALGTAAGVHAAVAHTLAARQRIGVLPRIRDNALITLGRTHAAVTAALLAALAAVRLGEAGAPQAELWARTGKAHGVDSALAAVSELVPLVGASGFTTASPLAKARADLAALQYADGIHDGLYRAGGKALLSGGQPVAAPEMPQVRGGPDAVHPATA